MIIPRMEWRTHRTCGYLGLDYFLASKISGLDGIDVLFLEILENGDMLFSSSRKSTTEDGHPVDNEAENAHAFPALRPSLTPSSLWFLEEVKER